MVSVTTTCHHYPRTYGIILLELIRHRLRRKQLSPREVSAHRCTVNSINRESFTQLTKGLDRSTTGKHISRLPRTLINGYKSVYCVCALSLSLSLSLSAR
uniref:Uncharacterized protein n=1 Tax=Lactuca sativa TaxID=4236 RepID=A0A9R1VDI9_LACSA|nr:hypothetical protein LSAT_V11C500230890 [Lactuca sativa]